MRPSTARYALRASLRMRQIADGRKKRPHPERSEAQSKDAPTISSPDDSTFRFRHSGKSVRQRPGSNMKRFSVTPSLEADCVVSSDALFGNLYHVQRNASGGALLTPVACYFATRPQFIEGYYSHWRLDCYFREHRLSPDHPIISGEALVLALIRENLACDPLWLSVHRSEELEGKAYGQVFEIESDDDV